MALSQSDKVVLTKYPIAPSQCVVCLRSSNGELNFIDFQMSLDIYGSVNICVDCLAPISHLLGFVEKGLLDEAMEANNQLLESIRELRETNDKLSTTLDSLFDIRPDLVRSDLSSDEEPTEDSGNDELQLDFGIEV